MHLELSDPRGATVSITIEPKDYDGGSVVSLESDLPDRTIRLLLAYLDAEGRDWAHFLRCGLWWDIAITNGKPPPQDPFDACDGRFGWPHDGAEGLGEIGALFNVLARKTSTPEVAFGAIFDTGSLAWHSYGPGPDHSVAVYSTDPDTDIHPELTVVPASQICSPEVTLLRTMPVFQIKVASVPDMVNLTDGRAHGVDALWPDGWEWLLTNDIDWGYSVLGCDRGTADAVLAADGVEAVELDPIIWSQGTAKNPPSTGSVGS